MSGRDLERIEFHGRVDLDFDTLGFVVVSSILASVALLAHSVPVLIGAMILAPAFDPLVAIPFGILDRDWTLLRKALFSSTVMFVISFVVCLGTVWALSATNAIPRHLETTGADMITERLTVGFHAIIIALAAGAGGALASASDRQSNLVGVVVALALVPALAAAAVAFQHEEMSGWGGLALFGVNVAGIIVSGLVVLYLRFGVGRIEEEIEDNHRNDRQSPGGGGE
ncbi:MAG: DUF389 domain-containing protein [Armatimonadota bacterium]